MKITNCSARKYIRQVRSKLPCSARMRTEILDRIRDEVSTYLEENPYATDKELLLRFGKPEDISASYIETMGAAAVLKKFCVRKWILRSIAAVLVFIALTWTAIAIYAVVKREQDDNGRIEIVIENN